LPKPWVIGILGRQLWSVAGPESRKDVNQLLLQPFVNYNLPAGFYLGSAPIITANWTAAQSNRWTVPVGGGVGKDLPHRLTADARLLAGIRLSDPHQPATILGAQVSGAVSVPAVKPPIRRANNKSSPRHTG
jgi:hypothetical protein